MRASGAICCISATVFIMVWAIVYGDDLPMLLVPEERKIWFALTGMQPFLMRHRICSALSPPIPRFA